MEEEEISLIGARDQMDEYIQRTGDALVADDPDEMRQRVGEAMPYGQNVLDALEDALGMAEEDDLLDHIELAVNHVGLSLDSAEQALESPDDEVEDVISEMSRHAQVSASHLNEAMALTA